MSRCRIDVTCGCTLPRSVPPRLKAKDIAPQTFANNLHVRCYGPQVQEGIGENVCTKIESGLNTPILAELGFPNNPTNDIMFMLSAHVIFLVEAVLRASLLAVRMTYKGYNFDCQLDYATT